MSTTDRQKTDVGDVVMFEPVNLADLLLLP